MSLADDAHRARTAVVDVEDRIFDAITAALGYEVDVAGYTFDAYHNALVMEGVETWRPTPAEVAVVLGATGFSRLAVRYTDGTSVGPLVTP